MTPKGNWRPGAHPHNRGGFGTRRTEAWFDGDQHGCSMKWLMARRCVAVACALATVGSATLAAQQARYDSTVISVRGNGPTTFVLITGMVGGVAGFRRLASMLGSDHRVVIID